MCRLIRRLNKQCMCGCYSKAKALTAAAAIREKVPDAKLDVIPGGNLEMTDLRMCSDYVKVGWCRLTISKPVLTAPMLSALETITL